MLTVSETDLVRACHILFGGEVDVTRDFLGYIQPAGVKTAYRTLARRTHPDHNHAHDDERTGRRQHELFIETTWAYEQLTDFLRKRDSGGITFAGVMRERRARRSWPDARDTARTSAGHSYRRARRHQPRPDAEHYFKGRLPARRLLFGQYLFFSGSVSWEALIAAIVWQRRQRPRLGDLARERDWLTSEQIHRIVRSRQPGEPIGEAAVRLRYLRRAQVLSLLFAQRRAHLPFGEYFVRCGELSANDLDRLIRSFAAHNARHPSFR
jgi:hypothetical protein